MAPMAPDPRPTNAFGDVVLTAQLLCFWWDFRSRQPKIASRTNIAAYYLYEANLLLAVVFTASGAVLHMTDPLPQEATMLWLVFVISCVATPIIYPAVCACAVYPELSPRSWLLCRSWLVLSTATHTGLVLTGVDLSGVLALPVVEFAGHVFDGSSIGGKPYGIESDLLSSLPSLKGSGLFLHAGLFTLAVLGSIFVLLPVAAGWEPPQKGVELRFVRRLTLATFIMLLGQLGMAPMAALLGIRATFDLWHAAIFTVMALAYTALREMISKPLATEPLAVASPPKTGEETEGKETLLPDAHPSASPAKTRKEVEGKEGKEVEGKALEGKESVSPQVQRRAPRRGPASTD